MSHSPISYKLKKFVDDEWVKLDQEQITPWIFMTTNAGLHLKRFNGKPINYSGVLFEGSPQLVFWRRYIEPFLEDITMRAIDLVISSCKEGKISPEEPLDELEELLKALSKKTFRRMVDIDQRLRGKGYPDSVKKRCAVSERAAVDWFITEAITSEKAMAKAIRPQSSINEFYNQHPFLFWIVAVLIGIVIAVLV